jgi:uncharacterized membrane protein
MSRGWKIALAVSLALNLFVLGAAGGVLYRDAQGPPGRFGGRGGPLGRAVEGLSGDQRAAFRQMLHDQVEAARPLIQDARRSRRQAFDLLSAPTFDRAAAGQAMAQARNDEGRIRAAMENAVLDFAARLSPQQRASMAEAIRKAAPVRWGGGPPPRPDGESGGPPP